MRDSVRIHFHSKLHVGFVCLRLNSDAQTRINAKPDLLPISMVLMLSRSYSRAMIAFSV